MCGPGRTERGRDGVGALASGAKAPARTAGLQRGPDGSLFHVRLDSPPFFHLTLASLRLPLFHPTLAVRGMSPLHRFRALPSCLRLFFFVEFLQFAAEAGEAADDGPEIKSVDEPGGDVGGEEEFDGVHRGLRLGVGVRSRGRLAATGAAARDSMA